MSETIGGDEGMQAADHWAQPLAVMSKNLTGVSYNKHEGESVLMLRT